MTIQRVSIPNLKLFGPMKIVKLDNFLLCYIGKWVGGHSFAHQHGSRNINLWRFSEH